MSRPSNEPQSRFESLSLLFGAMFAVLATGSIPESFVSQLKDTERELQRIAEQEPRPSYLCKIDDYVGVFTRVARAMQLSPAHVLQVASGKRKSARVVKALADEVRRIEAQYGPLSNGLSDQNAVRRLREYAGLASRIARQVGRSPSHVAQIIQGKRASLSLQRALAEEVERIESLSGGAA